MDRSLSVVIVCLNEAEHIQACINSVGQLADEIIVGDSGSTDGTVELARQAGAKVVELEWKGYGATKNALAQMAQFDWILSLDADEQLSPELRSELQLIKNQSLEGAYSFPRKNFYGKKWLRYGGWYPDQKIRLYNRKQGQWNRQLVHEELIMEEGIALKTLKGPLLHHTIKDRTHHLQTIDKYAQLRAQKLHASGKKQSMPEGLLRSVGMFLKRYLLKGGLLDGKEGFWSAWDSAKARWLTYQYLQNINAMN